MKLLNKLVGRLLRRPPSCSVVIAAGGSSQRMGGQDKLFADLCGVPVLARTLRAFEASPAVTEIIVVTKADSISRVSALCAEFSKVTKVVPGGESRLHSVFAGVMAADRQADLIAVHDGARPLVSGELIENVIAAAAKYKAALPLLQMRETAKSVSGGFVSATLDRDGIYAAQTPQVFCGDLLKAALQKALDEQIPVTDDAQAMELIGLKPAWVEGERKNIKITGPEDLLIARAFLEDK